GLAHRPQRPGSGSAAGRRWHDQRDGCQRGKGRPRALHFRSMPKGSSALTGLRTRGAAGVSPALAGAALAEAAGALAEAGVSPDLAAETDVAGASSGSCNRRGTAVVPPVVTDCAAAPDALGASAGSARVRWRAQARRRPAATPIAEATARRA